MSADHLAYFVDCLYWEMTSTSGSLLIRCVVHRSWPSLEYLWNVAFTGMSGTHIVGAAPIAKVVVRPTGRSRRIDLGKDWVAITSLAGLGLQGGR